jgi:hypothetical protein
MKLAGMAVM